MQSVFGKVIDRVSMFKKQEVQYTEKVLIEDTVPANSTKLAKASILRWFQRLGKPGIPQFGQDMAHPALQGRACAFKWPGRIGF